MEAVLALAQGGELLTTGDTLMAYLPRNGLLPLGLQSRVRHIHRMSLANYHVGLWFLEQDPGTEAVLQEWIDEHRG